MYIFIDKITKRVKVKSSKLLKFALKNGISHKQEHIIWTDRLQNALQHNSIKLQNIAREKTDSKIVRSVIFFFFSV